MRTESKVGERGGWGQERRHVRALTTRLSDLISFLIFNFNAAFYLIFNEPYFRTIKTIVQIFFIITVQRFQKMTAVFILPCL